MDFGNFTHSLIEVNSSTVIPNVDSSLSENVNMSTAIAEALRTTMSSRSALVCNQDTTPCANSYCLNGGVCCEHFGVKHCVCPDEYTGLRCARKKEDLIRFNDALQIIANQNEHIERAGISSTIFMIIGILTLAAFITFVVVLVGRKLLLKKRSEDYLEEHLSDIQQELNSMPTVSKLIQLTRLSKLFQQSARAAIETTVLSADVCRMVVSPSPHVACLPRWSSAPASLGAGARPAAGDEPDTATSPTYVEPSVRRKLKQVFSYDISVMARSQERSQQQPQQPQSHDDDDDGTRTTRL